MDLNLAASNPSPPRTKWRKVAYGGMQPGYDDNHADETFLDGMVMNDSIVERDMLKKEGKHTFLFSWDTWEVVVSVANRNHSRGVRYEFPRDIKHYCFHNWSICFGSDLPNSYKVHQFRFHLGSTYISLLILHLFLHDFSAKLCESTSLGMGGFSKTWRRSDVFSYGVILWELFTKQEPWKGVNPYRVIYHVGDEDGRLDFSDNMDPDIANIIRQCWKKQV